MTPKLYSVWHRTISQSVTTRWCLDEKYLPATHAALLVSQLGSQLSRHADIQIFANDADPNDAWKAEKE